MHMLLGILSPVMALAFLAAIYSQGTPKSRPKKEKKKESDHESAHTEDHAHASPVAAKSGGHDPHDHPEEKKDGWGLLKTSIGLLGLVVVAWLGSHAINQMGGFSIPQTRGQALAQASAMSARNMTRYEAVTVASRPASTEWQYYDAPPTGPDWYTITALPGWTIETCSVVTDPNCTDAEPHGYRLKCMNSAGLERDWSTGECKWLNSLSIQSTDEKPLRMKWRDKLKSP